MSDDALYLGVDGGGTGCRARLVDAGGGMLGEARGGPANARLGAATLQSTILGLARACLDQAGLGEAALGRIVAGFGLAGAGQPAGQAVVAAIDWPFAAWRVATDVEVACLGAHGGGDGGIVVLGTGSCGFARVAGRTSFVGGWGFPISDQGSGAWLGLEAIRAALRAHDGLIAQGPMTTAVLARFGGAEAIVAWLDAAKPGDYGTLAPLVLAAADQADPTAVGLVARAVEDVADMIERLADLGAPRIGLMGGLGEVIAPKLPARTRGRLDAPMADAMSGAIMLARARS